MSRRRVTFTCDDELYELLVQLPFGERSQVINDVLSTKENMAMMAHGGYEEAETAHLKAVARKVLTILEKRVNGLGKELARDIKKTIVEGDE